MCNHPRPPGGRQERQQYDENRHTGIYGDHLKPKKKGMVRLLFQNPQGLGPMNELTQLQTSKITKLKETLLKHDIDLLGLSEVNKDWRKIPHQQTLWSISDGWFEHRRLSMSINTKVRAHSKVQFGGTLMLAVNRLAHSIVSIDEDPRGLGRWTSMRLKGKNNSLCRIICAYCPCLSQGPSSTYALQVVGLATDNIFICPRIQFWTDLKVFINKCQNDNEKVIVMGDWNSDYADVTRWMDSLNLEDLIYKRHSEEQPPPTCVRSSTSPLDAIFAPNNMTCWRGGFLSFDYLESDHRGLWCDIPIEMILGYNMDHPAHAKARRLKAHDPRVRKKYLSVLHDILDHEDVYKKLDTLYNNATVQWLPTDIINFEEVDDTINKAMNIAEQKCRKLKTGIVKWSPIYQKACDRVTYWTMLQKESQGKRINTRKLLSLRKQLRITINNGSVHNVEEQLAKAKKEQKTCKKFAPELQMEFRYRLAKAKEEEDNIPAATHIRNLTKQENTRTLFRRIRYLERKINNLSTSRLTITGRDGTEREICNQKAIEEHIMNANEKKFHQTEGHGQLQTGQLLRDVGVMGTGPKSDSILDGTYRAPDGTSDTTRSFLQAMKSPDNYKVIPPPSYQDFCQGWSKAKERTSSIGPHFGHYKAAIHHPRIGNLLDKRSQIPIFTGYTPRRHREGLDVMLLKKAQNYNVDSLRTIVLFDSEANMNNKHTGRRAMDAAIQLNTIATEQYSRPQRKAIDHTLNRRLVMDHQLYQ